MRQLRYRSRFRTEVLYEDDDLVVVNKPPFHWPLRAPEDEPDVLSDLSRAGVTQAGDELYEAYPIDPAVSGLLVLSRAEPGAVALRRQLSDGRLTMKCLALVRARVVEDSGQIDLPLRARGGKTGLLRVDTEHGAAASTRWRLLDSFVAFALLECIPTPPIPHHVRVHVAAVNMPLAVDRAYRGADHLMLSSFKAGYRPSRRHEERPLIQRVSLHVQQVSFDHPGSGRRHEFEAAVPRDLRATIHQLDRFGRVPARGVDAGPHRDVQTCIGRYEI